MDALFTLRRYEFDACRNVFVRLLGVLDNSRGPKPNIGHFRGVWGFLDRLELGIEINRHKLAFLRYQNYVVLFCIQEPNVTGKLSL